MPPKQRASYRHHAADAASAPDHSPSSAGAYGLPPDFKFLFED
jgi:hypothetical protein